MIGHIKSIHYPARLGRQHITFFPLLKNKQLGDIRQVRPYLQSSTNGLQG